jgi:hypothetical protein
MIRANDCNIELWWDADTNEWVATLFCSSSAPRTQPKMERRAKQPSVAVSALVEEAHIVYPK